MRDKAICIAGVMLLAATATFGSEDVDRLDQMEVAPPDYDGPVFKPNYMFPMAPPVAEDRPWERIDFKAQPAAYMESVLGYVLAGQDTARWNVADNPVRKWYHMPWMGPGGQGREFISGLTSERRSTPGELGPAQTKCRQNWAVGFYNPTGGHALGKIWGKVAAGIAESPNLDDLPFPVGTVVAKMLYTEADESEVPLLSGAPTIEANIVRDDNPGDAACPSVSAADGTPAPRASKTLRLLQLDIAVRDPSADGHTGWIFGTFVYDGRLAGSNPWSKIKPVGLMWGNDPGLSDRAAQQGAKPAEGHVLSKFGIVDASGRERNFGRGDRMNGPVDNPVSSCLSCHMTAQTPSSTGMTAPRNANWDVAQCWFRNLGPATAFGSAPSATSSCGTVADNQRSLDYSLQLAVGVRNQAIARANADLGGINLLGLKLFSRKPISFDRPVRLNGELSVPVTRD